MAKLSEILTEHVMAPRNGGVMDAPDLTGHAGAPGRGAFLILFLKVRDGRVVAAKYHTHGCGPTIASGSMLTEMLVARTIAECHALMVEDLGSGDTVLNWVTTTADQHNSKRNGFDSGCAGNVLNSITATTNQHNGRRDGFDFGGVGSPRKRNRSGTLVAREVRVGGQVLRNIDRTRHGAA